MCLYLLILISVLMFPLPETLTSTDGGATAAPSISLDPATTPNGTASTASLTSQAAVTLSAAVWIRVWLVLALLLFGALVLLHVVLRSNWQEWRVNWKKWKEDRTRRKRQQENWNA